MFETRSNQLFFSGNTQNVCQAYMCNMMYRPATCIKSC